MTKLLEGKILVIDDEPNIREGLKQILLLEGHNVDMVENGHLGFEAILKKNYDVVICDLKMPIMDGQQFLIKALHIKPQLKIIVLTGHGTVDNAVESLKEGAYDFFIKPLEAERILITIQHALRELSLIKKNESKEENTSLARLVGKSKSIRNIIHMIGYVAKSRVTVLIEGESGTGKELVARSIHELSERHSYPLIPVHLAALNENLVETELFGYEKGAFTGAFQNKKGRFELAQGGTLFLDEIGEISPNIQVKLLRVLQEQVIERVGSGESTPLDVRIISATNKDLLKLVKKGEFREDLYYRLNIVNIQMPPLRQRKVDIPLIVDDFLREICHSHRKSPKILNREVLQIFENYIWPGNIRELHNVIERMVIFSDHDTLTVRDLPDYLQKIEVLGDIVLPENLPLKMVEQRYILETLSRAHGNKSKTADILGIERKTLYKKLEDFSL